MKAFLRRRSIRVIAALAVVSGTAGLASVTALTSSAQADPSFVSGYAGVGADVTQDLYAALGGASVAPPSSTTTFFTPLHSSATTNNKIINSFDADPAGGSTTAPGCVTTKLGGPSFDRPNSSTAGIAALLAAVNGTGWENSSASCTNAPVNVTGQIDFARSARGPKSGGTTLTFIPFGRDAVAVAYYDHSTGHLASLTTAELTTLYSSSTGTSTINGDTVKACLTLSGSTPRSNLETAIGVSDSTANTAATAAGCNQIEQNNANDFYTFASTLPAGTDAVIPISSGSWIGQANGVGYDRSATARANGVDLAAIDSLPKPYTGSAPTEAPNTTYYQSTQYGYNIYTVLPTSKLSGFTGDAALESLFVGSSSVLCSTTYQNEVHLFGFDSLVGTEGTCGSTSTTGNS
ncbi:MAG: hypothetical protein ACLQPH_02285 [Acidimicrobiales bacterium]